MKLSKPYLILMLGFLLFSVFLVIFFKNTTNVFISSKLNSKSNKIKIVNYTEAVNFEKQWVKVKMPVKYSFYNRKYLFLSSHTNPHHIHMLQDQSDKNLLKQFFTVKIWNKDLSKFPKNFESQIRNKEIIVEGIVTYYQGDPHIEVTNPTQITVIE